MKYQGVIKRVLYTNIGVEADSLVEAREKIRKMAECMEPDCYDYEEPIHIYLKQWGEEGRGQFMDCIEKENKNG